MTIEEFINEITRPLYVYRMAKSNLLSSNPSMVVSAQTRMKNATKEIQDAVEKYASYMEDD